MSYAASQKVV